MLRKQEAMPAMALAPAASFIPPEPLMIPSPVRMMCETSRDIALERNINIATGGVFPAADALADQETSLEKPFTQVAI